ncbi:serine/threonine-protein kinase [Polyangium sorediatum]|uniref:Serine/threonine-protein kinase n=1 Tax=Polyangium sorediatum TaxID=889274 RepID=A0ABT6PAH3_9BACT|nr:serine/threonine-protein kinase [Polyangium sorediatum]MDI1437637.1 serine/threonine-protein kinase [Polyangium sorediatum]
MNDRYQLQEKLGEGSFGTVYRAVDRDSGRVVAVKLLKDRSPDGRERFAREALVLYEALDNPFIVELLDHDLAAPQPHIVLEYCDQGPLGRLIGKLHWRSTAVILMQVITGLRAIHDRNGFHRDIKPDNLLVTTVESGTFVVKLADFGLARVPGVGTMMTRGPGGTPGYIAREILMGEPFSAAADIYSLGVVATELLTGTRDASALHRADVPPALRDLVLAMRSDTPENRPDARKIAEVLLSLLAPPSGNRPPPGPAVPPAPPTPPSSGPSAPLVIGGALLTVAAFAALAALAEGRPEWDASVRRYRGKDGQFKKG